MVREAILASAAWPGMAADMERLHGRGVDVAGLLADAHRAGVGVGRAVAAVLAAAPPAAPAATAPAAARTAQARDPWGPPPAAAKGPVPAPAAAAALPSAPVREAVVVSEDARRYWGPLTEGLALPADLDLGLGVRDKALDQLGVRPSAHARIVAAVNDVLGERDAGLLVGARPWPLLAARMQQLGENGGPDTVAAHLARLNNDDSWRPGPPGEFARRMVLPTHQALTAPRANP